jgi:hypothetical protein
MATIPMYPAGGAAQSAPLPNVRQSSVASPELFSVGAVQMEEAGRAVQQVGAVLADIQEREDRAAFVKAETALLGEADGFEQEASQMQGENAYGLGKRAGEEYDKRAQKIALNMSARPRAMFELAAMQHRRQFVDRITTHEVKQRREVYISGLQSRADLAVSRAIADPSKAQESRADLAALVAERAKAGGWGTEQTEAARIGALSSLHAGVVGTFLQRDPEQAKAYYYQHREEIAGEVQGKLTKDLEAGEMSVRRQRGADELMSQVRAGAMAYTDAEAAAREKYSGRLRDEVISELRSQHQDFKQATADAQEKALSPVFQLVGDARTAGRAIGRSQSGALLSELRGRDARLFEEATRLIDAHNDEVRAEGNAAAERARSIGSGNRELRGLMLRYDMLNNSEKWRSADLAEVLAPMVADGSLSPSAFKEAQDIQQKLRKPEGRKEFATLQTGSGYLKNRLESAVVEGTPFLQLPVKRQKEIEARALSVLDPLLTQYQADRGDKASPDEVRGVVDQIFVDTRYRETFMGITYGKPRDATKIDIDGAAGRVRAMVPPDQRARISTALRANGYEPTEALIREYWEAGAR